MSSKQKKMIVGGIVSAVVVGLAIFLILFFGEIGPFSKFVAPDEFWKKVEQIVMDEKTYNEQWYIKSERKENKDLWSVELFGSKNKDRANEDNVDKTLSEGKMFAWSQMTKALDACPVNFKMEEIHHLKDTNDEVTLYINQLIKIGTGSAPEVEATDFWKTVEEIRQKSWDVKRWYAKAMPIAGDAERFNVELYGSTRNEPVVDKNNIDQVISDGHKYMWSKMKMGDDDEFRADHALVCSLYPSRINDDDDMDVRYFELGSINLDEDEFWNTVGDFYREVEYVKRWYLKVTPHGWPMMGNKVELVGSKEDEEADSSNIEMTISEGQTYAIVTMIPDVHVREDNFNAPACPLTRKLIVDANFVEHGQHGWYFSLHSK